MDRNVYISYAPEDLDFAQKIKDKLVKEQIPCRMLSEKVDSQKDIKDDINQCKVFILVLSNQAQNSEQITEELRLAMSLKKRILPFMIEDFTLSDEYEFYLNNVQRYFAFDDSDREIQKLVDAIKESAPTPEIVSNDKRIDQNRYLKNWIVPVLVILFILGLYVFNKKQSPIVENVNASLPTDVEEQNWEIGEISTLVWENKEGIKWVDVLCPITNTGSSNIKLTSTTMELEGPDGTIVDMIEFLSGYPYILKPGETGYYFAERILYEGAPEEIAVVPNVVIQQTDENMVFFETSDINIVNVEEGVIRFTGKVKNNTEETVNPEDEFNRCYVVAYLYDMDDKITGIMYKRFSDSIAPGDTIDFGGQFYYPIASKDIDHYEVFAYSIPLEVSDFNDY